MANNQTGREILRKYNNAQILCAEYYHKTVLIPTVYTLHLLRYANPNMLIMLFPFSNLLIFKTYSYLDILQDI